MLLINSQVLSFTNRASSWVQRLNNAVKPLLKDEASKRILINGPADIYGSIRVKDITWLITIEINNLLLEKFNAGLIMEYH
jgi:hypothetical protein